MIKELDELRRHMEALKRNALFHTVGVHTAATQQELQGQLNLIGELRRYAAALHESESRLAAVFDQGFQLMGQVSIDGVLEHINQRAIDYLNEIGLDKSAALGKPFWETPWWNHSAIAQERLRDAVAEARGGKLVRYEATHPMGNALHYVDFSLKPVMDKEGRVVFLIAEGRDITPQKTAEKERKESEERFRALTESSPDTIMRFDRQGRHLYVNPSAERDIGTPASDWIGKTHAEMGFPPDLVSLWEERIHRVFETGRENRVEFMLPNGLWKDWLLAPEKSAEGEVLAVMTTARDITDRKRAEGLLESRTRELMESEEKYRILFEQSRDAMLIIDNNTFVDGNDATVQIPF